MFKKGYTFKDGIYIYPFSDKIVNKIKNFYKDDPFPNYEFNDDRTTIQKREIQTLTRMSLKNLLDMVKKLLKLDQELANYLII